jgi:RNA polymerase sigma factor (sigma-70 family)
MSEISAPGLSLPVNRKAPSSSAGSSAAMPATVEAMFDAFVARVELPLRQALVARYGIDLGCDACSAALGWAWEHRIELDSLINPVGYLYRVGQSSLRPQFAWQQRRTMNFPAEQAAADANSAVDLGDVVGRLTPDQRVCVLLVHAHGWTYRDVAELLNIRSDAVTNHVHRGTKKLRQLLQEDAP